MGQLNNNEENNLEVVCANCHIRRHLKFDGEKLIYNAKTLTSEDILKSIYNEK